MTNTYDTSALPLGSTDVKVLYNNASNFDDALNTLVATWIDRFGRSRTSWEGFQAQFAQFLIESGYVYTVPLDYAAGILITLPNQIFRKDGEYYRAGPSLAMPYTTTGVWATEGPLFVSVGDAALRSALAAASGAGLVGFDVTNVYTAGTLGAAVKALSLPLEKIVVLSSGQSNMPQDVTHAWAPEPNLYLWNYNSNTQASNVVGTQFLQASAATMGPSIVAANVIARENPRANVYVINIHRGGLGLVNWGPAPVDYNFRQAIEGNVAAALGVIGKSQIDHFVWGGCESDVNSQSQTIQPDMENYLFVWLKTHSWYNSFTPVYIFGMSPYAASAPGNGDFLWRRYNNALRAVVSTDPSCRSYVGLETFPLSMFDPTGVLPYIHRTPLGYYKSGEFLGNVMQHGQYEPCPRLDDTDGLYTPVVSNPVQCSVAIGYASFTRIGNNVRSGVFCTVTSLIVGQISFDLTVPVKAKNYPNNVIGVVTGSAGGRGVAIPVANTQTVRVVMIAPAIAAETVCIDWTYRVNSSDALPNSPPGTT